MSTVASLRWRARVTKEAVLNDDSSLDQEDHNKNDKDNRKRPRLSLLMLVQLMAAIASAASVVSLLVTHSWYMAIASSLTVSLSCLVVWQKRRLRKLGSMRHRYNNTRETVHSLRLQKERLMRQLTSLDTSLNKMHQVQSQLKRMVVVGKQDEQSQADVDIERLVHIVLSTKQVQEELQVQLCRQVQQEILETVLRTDRNQDFHLNQQEIEELILRLQSLSPGVTVNEQHLRDILSNNTSSGGGSSTSTSSSSLVQIVSLLRQVAADSTVSQYYPNNTARTTHLSAITPRITNTSSSPRSSKSKRTTTSNAIASSRQKQRRSTTVFQFDPQALLLLNDDDDDDNNSNNLLSDDDNNNNNNKLYEV